ncbi:MAG: ATP-binding protein [Candidatus Binatia bacterium]|nr:ATP-binding protein [Candidatus Binatia bacterium]MDG2009278.1 ATP-binding protein [Candidatus Binatia bacterium]
MDSSEKAPASSDLTPVVSQGEEQFQRVFAEAPIGMALFDSEYRFVLVNRALAQMLDTTEEALMGASCESILQPDEAAGQRLLAERLLGREVQGYKVQRRYPSGSRPERFADVTVTRIDTEDGGVLGLEMIEDITEARRAKEQTRVHEAELAHATRLAMLGEMVAGIAHEVNQPLAAIVNYANGSTRRLQSGDVQDMRVIQDALSRIASEAMRASEIVRRLKSLARKESVQRERQPLEEIAERTLRLVESEVQAKDVTIVMDLAREIPPVLVDPIQIEQIVLNLVRNACEAMLEQSDPKRVTIRTFREGDESVAISVADNGPGLSPALLHRVFDAFFTTKRSGLGMGLSISRSIAESHHGRLWAEENAPQGTVFTLALPIFGGNEN